MSAPNIVILMADQHRQDVAGCYGHPVVQTPNIDAIAACGTRFANAFCTSPLCGPSRVSFLTGTYPHTNGAITHPNDRHRSGKRYRPQLRNGIGSLVADLRDAGYRTHASGYIGAHHFDGDRSLEHDPQWLGFQTIGMTGSDYRQAVGKEVAHRYNLADICGEMWEPGYANVSGAPFPYDEADMYDSRIAADSAAFLAQQHGEQPFLLYTGFRAPHTPWAAPRRFHEMYEPADIGPLPDYRAAHHHIPRRLRERIEYFDIPYYPEDAVRRSIAAYYAFVSYMDDCVGRVLRALDDTGLRDNTIVVYAGDHGEMLYSHGLTEKHCFYEAAVRVPLIFSGPGQDAAGETREQLVSLMDALPTLCGMAGVAVPAHVEGLDLAPALAGEAVREHVLAEYYHSLDPCRMVRDHRYKYVHTEEDICELYDLRHDPGELLNLAWYPQYAELVEHYDRIAMADWEVPEVPVHATWNDLYERKQRQRLAGKPIADFRPPLPDWAQP